jgi:hypothetical protein
MVSCSSHAVSRQTSATSAASLTSSITSVDSVRVVVIADRKYQTNVFWPRPLGVPPSLRASCMRHMIVFQVRPPGGTHAFLNSTLALRRVLAFFSRRLLRHCYAISALLIFFA